MSFSKVKCATSTNDIIKKLDYVNTVKCESCFKNEKNRGKSCSTSFANFGSLKCVKFPTGGEDNRKSSYSLSEEA